jgi:hypothetical protein
MRHILDVHLLKLREENEQRIYVAVNDYDDIGLVDKMLARDHDDIYRDCDFCFDYDCLDGVYADGGLNLGSDLVDVLRSVYVYRLKHHFHFHLSLRWKKKTTMDKRKKRKTKRRRKRKIDVAACDVYADVDVLFPASSFQLFLRAPFLLFQ